MLLTNRRHRLIYFCLTGMEIAWITPYLLLLYRPLRLWSPFLIFALFFTGLLAWILIVELLSRYILTSPLFELSVLATIGLTSILLIRLLIYTGRGFFDLMWIFDTLRSVIRFEEGLAQELIVVLFNFFIWLRATNASSRDIDFWNVGLSFRVGMLLLIIGGGLLHQFSDLNALSFLWFFFTFGLTAVALTRIDEKSTDARSTGQLLPPNRLLQLLIMVGLTVTLTVWLSSFYSPDNLKAVLRWTTPLWEVIGSIILLVLSLIFWLIGPILLWLGEVIVNLFRGIDLAGLNETMNAFRNALAAAAAQGEQGESFVANIPAWVWIFLRYAGLAGALLIFLALIMVFLDKVRRRSPQDQPEVENPEKITLGSQTVQEGLIWLKETAGLIRHYGLSRQLLEAISVENIYANLCRIARKQGYPRRPAQPPDDYLSTLSQVFVGQELPLARITDSYMRVHYGGRTLTSNELSQIRHDYQRVRQAEKRARDIDG